VRAADKLHRHCCLFPFESAAARVRKWPSL